MSAQPALFPDPVVRSSTSQSGACPAPVVRSSTSHTPRGWRALPLIEKTVELPEPGVTGRRKLRFSYRPLAAWSDDLVRAAERLIGLYFQHFGGFRLADQAVLRAWVEALADFTAEEIVWALRAKWQSLQSANAEERRDKRKYVARPDKFPATIGHWLQQAPEHQERIHRELEASTRRRMDALNATRAVGLASAPAGVGQASAPVSMGQASPPVDASAAKAARAQRNADLERERQQFWDALSDSQRRAAVKATDSQFLAQCANYGRNPEDPQLDDLRRALALNWARLTWPPNDRSAPA